MADPAACGLDLRPPLLLPVDLPMAETGEDKTETEAPGSEGPQAFSPPGEHTGDEEDSEAAGRI